MDEPGLMLAIDEGGSCEGLAFRVGSEKLEYETFVLFRREMLAPVYRPIWLSLDTASGPIEALSFVANRDHEKIKPGILLEDQAKMIARAKGMFGTNFDYLSDMYERLEILGIEDKYVNAGLKPHQSPERKCTTWLDLAGLKLRQLVGFRFVHSPARRSAPTEQRSCAGL